MRRPFELSFALFLLAGFLIGAILPMPWDTPRVSTGANTLLRSPANSIAPESSVAAASAELLDTTDNFELLNTACYVVHSLRSGDYSAVASVVHPEKGVTFTPYSTVDFETNLTFTRYQIQNLPNDKTIYTWGFVDGKDALINMTMSEYFDSYVFNVDYSQAPQISVDQINISGNALENLTDAYPDCRFVDFSFPGLDAGKQGLDWCSLKLVFQPGDTRWYLVGVIHSQWTV